MEDCSYCDAYHHTETMTSPVFTFIGGDYDGAKAEVPERVGNRVRLIRKASAIGLRASVGSGDKHPGTQTYLLDWETRTATLEQ